MERSGPDVLIAPPRWTYEDLVHAERTKLEELVRTRPGPEFNQLVGWEFRGYNAMKQGAAPWVYPISKTVLSMAGFKRFIKLFFRRAGEPDPNLADMTHGCNKMVVRGGLDDPWDDKLKRGAPVHHGFYNVFRPGGGKRRFGPYAQSLFLDYSVPENSIFDGGGVLYDYLVHVTDDLMLGKAFIWLRWIGLRVPISYFVLERLREHDFIR